VLVDWYRHILGQGLPMELKVIKPTKIIDSLLKVMLSGNEFVS
jgi:hypothetical protein